MFFELNAERMIILSLVLYKTAVADAAHLVLLISVIGIPGVVLVGDEHHDAVTRRTVVLASLTFQNLSVDSDRHGILAVHEFHHRIAILIFDDIAFRILLFNPPFIAFTKVLSLYRLERKWSMLTLALMV